PATAAATSARSLALSPSGGGDARAIHDCHLLGHCVRHVGSEFLSAIAGARTTHARTRSPSHAIEPANAQGTASTSFPVRYAQRHRLTGAPKSGRRPGHDWFP